MVLVHVETSRRQALLLRATLSTLSAVCLCSEVLILSTSWHQFALFSTSGLDHGLDLHLLQRPTSYARRNRKQRQHCPEGLGPQGEGPLEMRAECLSAEAVAGKML